MEKISKRFLILPYLILGIGLLIIGLLSINHIVNNFWPIDVDRIDLVRASGLYNVEPSEILKAANSEIIFAFLGGIIVAITGLVLPLAYYLNKRFKDESNVNFVVPLRQSMWIGIWVALCTWLQMHRVMNLGVALLTAAIFIIIELLLQMRTKAANLTI